jgi:2-keto-3-deoxy-L-fuconate dehydrogenase
MFELSGRRAVVTGGASGIGLAIGKLFASQGASVVLLDLDEATVSRAAASLSEQLLARRVSGAGAPPEGLVCDVTREESVVETFARIGEPMDILVNCAGIGHRGSLTTTSMKDMDRLYAVNVKGTALCMQTAIKPMIAAHRGVILNICSIAATAGLNDRFGYSMTKGAVLAMTFSVAKDYLDQGVRCNCISPARVHTPFVDNLLAKNFPGKEAEQMEVLAKAQPIGRMARPDEIAALALYLCSEEASFITGVDYPIDGGFFNLR